MAHDDDPQPPVDPGSTARLESLWTPFAEHPAAGLALAPTLTQREDGTAVDPGAR